ncbi:phage terminase large subunit, partial [Acinetobacter baumannii]|nr:phage terminase large subunit [Acinetobacter baumannii]
DKDGATVSRYTFASQYMQNPKKLGGDLVKAEWIPRYLELPVLKWRAIWADTAQTTKEHNDFSVFLCAGLGYDNNLYIIDVKRGKWEAPELLKEAKAFINKHKDSNTKIGKLRYMAVEDKASGTGLIQSISKQTTLPIRAIQRSTDKLSRT